MAPTVRDLGDVDLLAREGAQLRIDLHSLVKAVPEVSVNNGTFRSSNWCYGRQIR
jgi:hypothetical protein